MALQELACGALSKMRTELADLVRYSLELDGQSVSMNGLLGRHMALRYLGQIHCCHCGRRTARSFGQGYCYLCFTRLACCDHCIVSPEKCHFSQGTCREPDWGQRFCMSDHVVYLANSSGPKVGITRISQMPTRWIDQGARQALPILRVATRQQSGLVEDILRARVADRTNWRNLLKGEAESLDLCRLRDELLDIFAGDIEVLRERFGMQSIEGMVQQVLEIRYPVESYPQKIVSLDLEKNSVVEGTLLGIKGQYLILDTGVINIRKYSAYQVSLWA